MPRFFHRPETFALGVCNGCQMMSQLKDLMVGAESFPARCNKSARFGGAHSECNGLSVPNLYHSKGMQDSILLVAIAHGEGYANLDDKSMADLTYHGQIALRYVDSQGNPTEHYPLNPNGSPQGIRAFVVMMAVLL